jgi:hypothetical protein
MSSAANIPGTLVANFPHSALGCCARPASGRIPLRRGTLILEEAETVGFVRTFSPVDCPVNLVDDALQSEQGRPFGRARFIEIDRRDERGGALICRQPEADLTMPDHDPDRSSLATSPSADSLSWDGKLQCLGSRQADNRDGTAGIDEEGNAFAFTAQCFDEQGRHDPQWICPDEHA